jgi:P-type Ca2+ transporter type 2C
MADTRDLKNQQFQLTVNVTAVVLTFVSAVASPGGESVLNAVQLLWVNLIMDTFAALALATDPPARSVLDRKPDRKSAPLITLRMAKMIIGQAICQLAITLVLNFAGKSLLGYSTWKDHELADARLKTLVFNTFVWLQIFNELKCVFVFPPFPPLSTPLLLLSTLSTPLLPPPPDLIKKNPYH